MPPCQPWPAAARGSLCGHDAGEQCLPDTQSSRSPSGRPAPSKSPYFCTVTLVSPNSEPAGVETNPDTYFCCAV